MAQSFRFENLTDEDGLRGLNVSCMIQDKFGYLWIGTDGGLHRYDGRKFELHTHDSKDSLSIASNQIQSILEDSFGNLWVGTRKGLNKYDRDRQEFSRFLDVQQSPKLLLDKSIRSLYQDRNGYLWVGVSELGLLKFDIKKETFTEWYQYKLDKSNELPSNHVKVILEGNGRLIIGSDNGITTLKEQSGAFENYQNELPNVFVKSIFKDINNNYWIGTDHGVAIGRWNKQKLEFTTVYPDIDYVKDITQDEEGNIWIASDDGMFISNAEGDRLVKLNHNVDDKYSLASDHVRTLLLDNQGILWAGTTGGISKWIENRFPFTVIQRNSEGLRELTNNYVTSVALDEGFLWLGTQNGLNRVHTETRQVKSILTNSGNRSSLSNNYISVLDRDNNGTIWAGTERGINKITRNGQITTYLTENDDKSDFVQMGILSIHVDIENNVWVGTWDGLLKYDPLGDRFIAVMPDLIVGRVQSIYRDREGDLWLGKRNGLSRIQFRGKRELFTHFQSATHNMTSNDIISLTKSNSGIWIGSNGGGLMHYDIGTGTFTHYGMSDGLASNEINSLVLDEEDILWIGSSRGITRFSRYPLQVTNYNREDGLLSEFLNLNAVAISADGQLFFGSANGVVSFDPSTTKPLDNKVIPRIESLKLMNDWVLPQKTTVLPQAISKLNKLEIPERIQIFGFRINAIDLVNGSKSKIQYKLEGYDTEWHTADLDQPEAIYSGVEPGKYTFKVRAANGSGVWSSQVASLSIEITPPLWKTTWFIVLTSILLTGILGIVVWSRVKQSQDIKKYLVEEVRKQTAELENKNRSLELANTQIKEQNERIMAQSQLIDQEREKLAEAFEEIRNRNIELENTINQLKSTQNQLIESEKMASIGFLAAGLAHELNNPLNFIGGVIGPVKRDINEIRAILSEEQENDNAVLFEEMNVLLDHIADGAQKATQIIRNLLDLTPTQKNEGRKRAVVDINELLTACVFLIKKGQSKVAFDLNLQPNLKVLGNAVELNQVFINIIKNSIDALQTQENPLITIQGNVSNGIVKLSFKDNGGGMDELVINNIYEPFYTTKGPGKGTGLGLYISRSIIMKHSGEIDVLSEPDKGTEFVISLQQYESPELV